MLLEIAHHAGGGLETEGAATGQQNRVHAVDQRRRSERVGTERRGRGAADVDAANRAAGSEDDRASGPPDVVGPVSDVDPRGKLSAGGDDRLTLPDLLHGPPPITLRTR